MKQESIKTRLKYHMLCIMSVILICCITTILSFLFNTIGIDRENLLMVMLVGVLISTIITKGFFYGLLTSLASIVSFNFFFTKPVYTLAVSDPQDLLLLVFFTLAASISGVISSKLQKQTLIALENERTSQLMYEITESFLNLTGAQNIVEHTLEYLYKITDTACMVNLQLSKYDLANSSYCIPPQTPAGVFDGGIVYPVRGLTSEIGTVIFSKTASFNQKEEKLLQSTIYQMALVLDREYIYLERERIRLEMESEHLKSTLLRSISHDIRTPLTEISGAGHLIADNIDTLSREEILRFVSDINTETEWLTMTVQNILNMTKISDGRLDLNMECESMDDLLSQAVTRLPASYDQARLKLSLPDNIILVPADGSLLVQVLLNLLDNAYKHSGPDSTITLSGSFDDGRAVFSVSDNGCGIPQEIMDHVFDSFVTQSFAHSDNERGVGLGLAICQAIIKAHDGTITAENLPSGGVKFTISLPGEAT